MFRSSLSLVLSLLLMALPAWAVPPDQTAGEVKALVPNASRNAQPLTIKATLQWNDLLQTNTKGRLRVGLTDGSTLSLGPNSQLKVVQHDGQSQQTSLDLNYGKLRNQVVKLTKPGGKYEVRTPNAVIGVVGTDFYVAYINNQTTVICYEGLLTVTPIVGAATDSNSGSGNAISVPAGQMIVIGPKVEQSGYQSVAASGEEVKSSMRGTTVPDQLGKSHRGMTITLVALAVVAGLTVGLTQANSSSKPCGCK